MCHILPYYPVSPSGNPMASQLAVQSSQGPIFPINSHPPSLFFLHSLNPTSSLKEGHLHTRRNIGDISHTPNLREGGKF